MAELLEDCINANMEKRPSMTAIIERLGTSSSSASSNIAEVAGLLAQL